MTFASSEGPGTFTDELAVESVVDWSRPDTIMT